MAAIETEFARFRRLFEAETTVRESLRNVVRELEAKGRAIAATLSQAHLRGSDVGQICAQARAAYPEARQLLQQIAALIPPERYYRYNDMWRGQVQHLCYCAALVVFLESGRLLTVPETEQLLGIKAENLQEFHFDAEDFLLGLCALSNELARLAVNSVIAENYQRPVDISVFVAELYEGFQLLNLKNDNLRKRFDSIKYDIKKIEEIVYDLSIRGLIKKAGGAASAAAGGAASAAVGGAGGDAMTV
eukprot:Unigene7846_Nuclearia_a/m.24091 Unigene7846_Nuclearia_a/g.24091  ORF Unigene7846_Nuclearia_a/g.24091 Unigene7846_Nuclearia_a/m.24091 type:complete len:247 (-) Unigene7846_Nuclearia_a:24-764(-)